jgi:hypothetical protein
MLQRGMGCGDTTQDRVDHITVVLPTMVGAGRPTPPAI